MYSDIQLKKAIASILPRKIKYIEFQETIVWRDKENNDFDVLDSELLHICQLIENSLGMNESYELGELYRIESKNVGERGGHFTPNGWGCFALANLTWQQRVICLAKIKKITI